MPNPGGHDLWAIAEGRARPVLASLMVGPADDPNEREAERLATIVTGGGDTPLIRSSPDEDVQRAINRSAVGTTSPTAVSTLAPASVGEVLRSPGAPLAAVERELFESRLGDQLGSVRIHHDTESGSAAEAVGAKAFTVGEHVVFGPGRYRPATTSGRHLLAHELVHVLQQRRFQPVVPAHVGGPLRRSADDAPATATPDTAESPAPSPSDSSPSSGTQPPADSSPTPSTSQTPSTSSTTPSACLPLALGTGRSGCGSGTDFTHFDFPSISTISSLKVAAWALAVHNVPTRGLVSTPACEVEMAAVLAVAGSSGLAAFSRFRAGTGGTETLGPGSALNTSALTAPSFLATVATVKKAIETQLAAQAAAGALDPCALSIGTVPETHFALGGSDPVALQAVIGGTHGEQLFATGFSGSVPSRTYSIGLHFLICDNFGVDEHDLYAPGLIPFWVLQHERDATLYAPFINVLDLTVPVSGTF